MEVPVSRRILSEVFNGLVRFLTGVPLKDTQSGLKAMRKSAFIDVFPRLAVKRYAFDVELLAVANLYGLKVVEMPVNIKLDAKFKPKEMVHMFIDLLGIAYRLRVIHWYQRQIPTKNGFQNLCFTLFFVNNNVRGTFFMFFNYKCWTIIQSYNSNIFSFELIFFG